MNIVYEDNHLLVVVKPPNMLSQGDATGDADLHSLAKAYIKEKYQKPGEVYLGLVHRMDRPVGGLIVFAKTSKAAERLSKQVATHEMGRTYLAVVEGNIPKSGMLKDWLLKDEKKNMVCSVPESTPNAKYAELSYRCLGYNNTTSLVEVHLKTGRNHQIRVQFSHAGFPLWGDIRYGHGVPGRQIALWGACLTLTHPTLNKEMRFFSRPDGCIWQDYQNEINTFFTENEVNI